MDETNMIVTLDLLYGVIIAKIIFAVFDVSFKPVQHILKWTDIFVIKILLLLRTFDTTSWILL